MFVPGPNMAFQLSQEEQLIAQTVREFARRIGVEKAAEFDRYDRMPLQELQEAAGLGLATMAVPAEGTAPATAYAAAVYEMAQVCPNTAILLAVQNTAASILAEAGRTELVAEAAAGNLVSLLVTEEAHGSDVAKLGTTAKKGDGGFLVTGQKVWGMAAAEAKVHLVLADLAQAGPSLFAVPAGSQGVVLSGPDPIMGLRATGIRTVYLSKAAVVEDRLVGEPGKGLEAVRRAQPWLQVGAAAVLCGCVAGALEAAARFAETRVQFGQPIGSYQAVSDAVTNMDTQLAAGRALVFEAAGHLGSPEAATWAGRAKAFCNEMAVNMTRQAIRVQGGTGFMREGGTERYARDVRALQFVGETTQMQRNVLKRAVLPGIEFPATP
jgi:alkylation response protein AidB-like acyl-CoA dehydrogenase